MVKNIDNFRRSANGELLSSQFYLCTMQCKSSRKLRMYYKCDGHYTTKSLYYYKNWIYLTSAAVFYQKTHVY